MLKITYVLDPFYRVTGTDEDVFREAVRIQQPFPCDVLARYEEFFACSLVLKFRRSALPASLLAPVFLAFV